MADITKVDVDRRASPSCGGAPRCGLPCRDGPQRLSRGGRGSWRGMHAVISADSSRKLRRPTSGAVAGINHEVCAAPTVSAIVAPRAPSGFSFPTVVSRAVWCSISELSSAPKRITIAEIQIHIIVPIAAPSDP